MSRRKKITRREFLKVTGLAGGAVAVVSLGNTPDVLARSAALAEERFLVQQSGGILKVVTSAPPEPINPYFRTNNNVALFAAVLDTLMRYDENVNPTPHLAESWEWSDDLLSLTFKLRQDVQFSSGNPFNAEAVKQNVVQLLKDEVPSQAKGAFTDVGIDTPDDYTVVFNLKEADVGFFDVFETFNVMDPAFFDQQDSVEGFIGTGPFVLTDWVPGSSLTLEPNPYYWQADLPILDGVEISVVPDQDAMILTLESNAAHIAINPQTRDMKRLQDNSDFQVILSPNESQKFYVGANVLDPLLSDKRVRQALNYAIPRERYDSLVNQSLTPATCVPWATISPAFDAEQNKRYRLDLDKAKSLLDEAGVAEGTTILLEYGSQKEGSEDFVVIYQEALTRLGFKVEVQAWDNAAFSDRLTGKLWDQLWVGLHGNANLTPTNLLTQNLPYVVGRTASNFASDEYAQLIEDARTEADPAKRKDLYHQLTELILDESFIMPFASKPDGWILSAKVSGFNTNKYNWIWYENISLS